MSRIPDFSQIPFQQAPAQGDAEFAAWKEKLKTETGKSFEIGRASCRERV